MKKIRSEDEVVCAHLAGGKCANRRRVTVTAFCSIAFKPLRLFTYSVFPHTSAWTTDRDRAKQNNWIAQTNEHSIAFYVMASWMAMAKDKHARKRNQVFQQFRFRFCFYFVFPRRICLLFHMLILSCTRFQHWMCDSQWILFTIKSIAHFRSFRIYFSVSLFFLYSICFRWTSTSAMVAVLRRLRSFYDVSLFAHSIDGSKNEIKTICTRRKRSKTSKEEEEGN